jgi:threonyl-tRNA synthetase
MLIVGDKEIADSTVSVRLRSGELASQSFESFRKALREAIRNKVKTLEL